jgi:hypothetical protein
MGWRRDGGCFMRRPRVVLVLLLLAERGGTWAVGEMVEGWPMDVTTDSSMLW